MLARINLAYKDYLLGLGEIKNRKKTEKRSGNSRTIRTIRKPHL
jgi:hypothetical protein